MKQAWALAMAGLVSATLLVLTGCQSDGTGSDRDTDATLPAGVWTGFLEDAQGRLVQPFSVGLSAEGRIERSATRAMGDEAIGVFDLSEGRMYSFELEDITVGGFLLTEDRRYMGFVDEDWNIAILEPDPVQPFVDAAPSDLEGDWEGLAKGFIDGQRYRVFLSKRCVGNSCDVTKVSPVLLDDGSVLGDPGAAGLLLSHEVSFREFRVFDTTVRYPGGSVGHGVKLLSPDGGSMFEVNCFWSGLIRYCEYGQYERI